MSVAMPFSQVPLGAVIPPLTAHAISVSLPSWCDVVGYEEGDARVMDVMETGYPRFFIHRDIQKLAGICEQRFATKEERCLLLPSLRIAEACRAFIITHSSNPGPPFPVHFVQYSIQTSEDPSNPNSPTTTSNIDLHIVLFPKDAFPLAKQFWQHAGLNISSRVAKRCLSILSTPPASLPTSPTDAFKSRNRHYAAKKTPPISPQADTHVHTVPSAPPFEQEEESADTYLEERYGRNLSLSLASQAKRALRRRIAQVLTQDQESQPTLSAGEGNTPLASSTRVTGLSENDVYLFPTGMSAIWSAHQLALATRPSGKSVCFGFPYTDTLKILQKWGSGCHFLGRGLDSDIETLEGILSQSPILALFTEFPSNPLLRCANLRRLRELADMHDFLMVVDETIGNFANVEILPFADIVVSSLTKIFSGDANVMGGSLVLNPEGRHYSTLKQYLDTTYEDVYFDEDAVFLERNSRNFQPRTRLIDTITESICDYLYGHSLASPSPLAASPVIKKVYYPKYITREYYDACRLPGGGYGGLFSVTFTSMRAATAFYDALDCFKGPSLGTNFTLACPYSILAHYTELDWAARWDVEPSLVRVSVGMEDPERLMRAIERSLRAAEEAATDANRDA